MGRDTTAITIVSIQEAQERLNQALEAIECEAYSTAAVLAQEASEVLLALNRRLVRERMP